MMRFTGPTAATTDSLAWGPGTSPTLAIVWLRVAALALLLTVYIGALTPVGAANGHDRAGVRAGGTMVELSTGDVSRGPRIAIDTTATGGTAVGDDGEDANGDSVAGNVTIGNVQLNGDKRCDDVHVAAGDKGAVSVTTGDVASAPSITVDASAHGGTAVGGNGDAARGGTHGDAHADAHAGSVSVGNVTEGGLNCGIDTGQTTGRSQSVVCINGRCDVSIDDTPARQPSTPSDGAVGNVTIDVSTEGSVYVSPDESDG